MPQSNDFSLPALYEALDAQRRARGLSWARATREINRQSARGSAADATPVLSPSTVDASARLPDIRAQQVLRFDTQTLHAALNTQRLERQMSWAQVAMDVGLSVSSLTHLSTEGRTAFPSIMRIVRWLRQPAAHFMRGSDR